MTNKTTIIISAILFIISMASLAISDPAIKFSIIFICCILISGAFIESEFNTKIKGYVLIIIALVYGFALPSIAFDQNASDDIQFSCHEESKAGNDISTKELKTIKPTIICKELKSTIINSNLQFEIDLFKNFIIFLCAGAGASLIATYSDRNSSNQNIAKNHTESLTNTIKSFELHINKDLLIIIKHQKRLNIIIFCTFIILMLSLLAILLKIS